MHVANPEKFDIRGVDEVVKRSPKSRHALCIDLLLRGVFLARQDLLGFLPFAIIH